MSRAVEEATDPIPWKVAWKFRLSGFHASLWWYGYGGRREGEKMESVKFEETGEESACKLQVDESTAAWPSREGSESFFPKQPAMFSVCA